MKKVQIIPAGKEAIEGYSHIKVDGQNQQFDMSEFSDNSCESILASDILDIYSIQNHQPILQMVVSKLRLGGNVVIGGTSLSAFCRTALTGVLSPDSCCSIISRNASMSDPTKVSDLLSALGLKIESVHIDGLHFEVKAKRG